MEKRCRNCNYLVEDSFCSACGQKYVKLPFSFGNTVGSWTSEVIDFNRGYFWTTYNLIFKPNILVSEYLVGKIKNYTNPIKFLILTIGMIAFLEFVMTATELSSDSINGNHDSSNEEWLGYVFGLLFMIPVYFCNILFYAKSKYKIFEHLIISLYEASAFLLLTVPSTLLVELFLEDNLTKNVIIVLILTVLTAFYHIFYLKKVFQERMFLTILKGLATIIISFALLTFFFVQFET